MSILITFLTLALVVNCLFLILLVLIQLPKKDAGAGLAFGAGATDALFGSGSGNALTKLTKYSAGVFLVVSLAVGLLHSRNARASSSTLRAKLAATKPATSPAAKAVPAPATNIFTPITTSNSLNVSIPPAATQTNIPAPAPATKAATPTTNATAPATK